MSGLNDAQFEKRAHGAIILDGQEVAHTLQCCHCNKHFISRRGSGIIRGYCPRCQAITCGDPACHVCVPFEKQLEMIERAARG